MLNHHYAVASGALPSGPMNPLGLVGFEELGELLRVSRPTLERLIRKDATFPRLFRIGGKRYARFEDLRIWVEAQARAA